MIRKSRVLVTLTEAGREKENSLFHNILSVLRTLSELLTQAEADTIKNIFTI